MSLQNIPYNSKIYLLSTLDYRYEGTLNSIDTADNTITLTNVRSLGTLHSPIQIPPVYEYFIFRASDIKHIEVSEPVVYLTNQYTGYPSYVLLPFFLWNQGNPPPTPAPAQTPSTPATVDPKAVVTMELNLKDSVFDSSFRSSTLDASQVEPQVTVTDQKPVVTVQDIKATLTKASDVIPRPELNQSLSRSVPNKKLRNQQEKIWKLIGKPVENTSTSSPPLNSETTELMISEKDKMNSTTKQPDSSGWKLDNSRGGQRFQSKKANLKYRPKESPQDSEVIIHIVKSNPEKSFSCEDNMETITLVPSPDDPELDKNKKHQRK